MQGIKIETSFELDATAAVSILKEVGDFIENEGYSMEDHELMDGSYKVYTSYGSVFLSIINEDSE
jgi:hypothetical protein